MQITKERISFLSKYYKRKEYVNIYDLKKEYKEGTHVEFNLPYKIKKDNESDNN